MHASGFDSIPSDLGVLTLREKVAADGAGELEDTTFMVVGARGGLSGGTFDSLMGQLDEAKADSSRAKTMNDPYALSPDRSAEPDLGDESDLRTMKRDTELGAWLAPFMMAGINIFAVRGRTRFRTGRMGASGYREVMGCNNPPRSVMAGAVTAGVMGLLAGLSFGPSRSLIVKVLPSAGEGPSEKARENGFFKIEIHTRTSTGARYVCKVSAKGDPGYKATSVMLGEAGLCLALDKDRSPQRAGVLTPATAMGMPPGELLRAADFTFEANRSIRVAGPRRSGTSCAFPSPYYCCRWLFSCRSRRTPPRSP